ncbi:MAG: hypothetical protein MUF42_12530 [Cytophagaceae bacterium]|nr:hypothetical protein [Cytophagaceae bacterium]
MTSFGRKALLLFTLAFWACTGSQTDSVVKNDTLPPFDTLTVGPKKPAPAYDTVTYAFALTKQDKVMLNYPVEIEPGFSYTEVHAVYPALKGIRPESSKDYLAEDGYTESISTIPMLGGEVKWEVNFKDDSVYYHFFTCQKSEEQATQLFQSLTDFYSLQHGPATKDPLEEENTFSRAVIWQLKDQSTLFLKLDLNNSQLFWGRRIDQAL